MSGLFTRDARMRHGRDRLWSMELPDGETGRCSRTRRFVMAFPALYRTAAFDVWAETTVGEYYYAIPAAEFAQRRNKRFKEPPSFREVEVIDERSRRTIPATDRPLERFVIEALGSDALTGKAAEDAVYQLFWLHFVEDDTGLSYLYHRVDRGVANNWARYRTNHLVDTEGRDPAADRRVSKTYYVARDAIYDVTRNFEIDGLCELGERVLMRLPQQPALQLAVEAVVLASEPPEVREHTLRQLVYGAATDDDLAIALIISATRGSDGLLGHRAVQRLAVDPAFKATIVAHGHAIWSTVKKDAATLKLLKQQFRGRKL